MQNRDQKGSREADRGSRREFLHKSARVFYVAPLVVSYDISEVYDEKEGYAQPPGHTLPPHHHGH